MLLTYDPEDVEPRVFVFRPAELRSVEAEALEEVGGGVWDNFDEFGRLFLAGNRRALRAALWLCRRRTEPGLSFEGLDVGVYDVRVGYDDDELARIDAATRALEDEAGTDGEAGSGDPKAEPGGPSPA